MKLEQIGFYTLSDERCQNSSENSPLQRCELILTGRCNFKCPYCRRVGGPDIPFLEASRIVQLWASQGLRAIRFSGGEPTLYPGLYDLVATARDLGIEHIALSTNGSADRKVYDRLLYLGVNDFSISLDACCAEDNLKMTGGVRNMWDTVVSNIRYLATRTYVTVGIVLTDMNIGTVNDIIRFAHNLGVADIRVIPAAQNGDRLEHLCVDTDLLEAHPILRYRILNVIEGHSIRGLRTCDSTRCGLMLDDMAVNGEYHYPCIIYLREGGEPIGKIGENMREERKTWYDKTNTHENPICKSQCLDVCSFYNNQYEKFHRLVNAGFVHA